jgi:outer membrane protein
MTLNKRLLLIIFLFFFNISNVSAANNLAFIDLDLVLKNSNLGKNILSDLNQKKKEELKNLKIKEDKLKSQENEIKKKSNIIKKEDLEKEVNLLKKDIKEFRKYKINIQKKFEKDKNDQIISFFNKINPLIQEYLDKNSIQVLFNKKNIFIGNKNLDITDQIINIINEKIK